MRHLDAIVAVACPNVNSYKRMRWSPPQAGSSAEAQSGFSWAPVPLAGSKWRLPRFESSLVTHRGLLTSGARRGRPQR